MARVVGAIGILLFAASLAGQNLLKNGSFDKDLSSWTLLGGTQATWVPDDALSRASGSVRTVDTVIIQSVPVTPGVRYYLRGFVTRNAGSVSLGSLVAGWCADLACTTAAVSVGQYFFVGAGRGTGEWQLISGEGIAPPNAVAASINVGHDGQAFDEVYFSTTPPPLFRAISPARRASLRVQPPVALYPSPAIPPAVRPSSPSISCGPLVTVLRRRGLLRLCIPIRPPEQ